jgi:hypothetical protein
MMTFPTTVVPVWSGIVIQVVEGGIGIGVLHLTIAEFLHRKALG